MYAIRSYYVFLFIQLIYCINVHTVDIAMKTARLIDQLRGALFVDAYRTEEHNLFRSDIKHVFYAGQAIMILVEILFILV